MKLRNVFAAACAVFAVLLSACANTDRPPELDTPEPAPYVGLFSSEHGSLEFAADGEHVYVVFDDLLREGCYGTEDGLCEYSFSWYGFGPCRRDVATRLYIYSDNADGFFFCINTAGESYITLTAIGGEQPLTLTFTKTEN